MLEINNLTFKIASKKILDDISLKIGNGEIIGLFGENGSGKTSLMKCILGFNKYDGDIRLDGDKISYKNISKIAFGTSEHSFFDELTIDQHRDFLKDVFPKFNEKRFDGLVEFFGLSTCKKLTKMSQGQQNQFETIMALSQGADYILLDEPFTANDMLNREDFYKMILGILEENETIIISTHLIEEISGIIDRAIIIERGGKIEDISSSELEDRGDSLVEYIKKTCNYRTDRVAKALGKITGEE